MNPLEMWSVTGGFAALIGWLEMRMGSKIAQSERVQEAKNEAAKEQSAALNATIKELGVYVRDLGNHVAALRAQRENQ